VTEDHATPPKQTEPGKPITAFDLALVRRTYSDPRSWPVPALVAEIDRLRAKGTAIDVRPPAHTRLILASEDLLDTWGTRTDRGERITVEWGDEQPEGWYEPVFTQHSEDKLPDKTEARRLRAIEAAARALMAANCGDGHPGEAHDRLLHEIEQHDESCSGSFIHDCSNCGGQMYGTESDLRDLLDPATTEPKEPE
jgi:hypothetical protein